MFCRYTPAQICLLLLHQSNASESFISFSLMFSQLRWLHVKPWCHATFTQCRSELTGLKLQIPLTSCLVSVSTSPAALTWTWTVTPTRRTTMTGIVRKPRPLAHVCLCVGAGGGFFIPEVVPTPPLASAVCFTAVRSRRVRSSIT